MADLRCPMCGKPNPANADACKYCGARLKPAQTGESKPAGAAPKPGAENADWMSDLRGDMMRNRPKTSMLPPEPPAPAPPSDVWLSKIDARGGKESKPAAPASKPKTPREPAPAPPPEKAAEPSGNWLSKVRPSEGKESRPAAPAVRPPASAPGSAAEPPERPAKARTPAEADRRPPAGAPDSDKGGEEPVWLKRLRARRTQDELAPAQPAQPEAEPAAPGELPDWLSRIREKTTEDTGRIDAEDRSLFSSPLSAPAPDSPAPQTPSSPWGTPAPPQKPRAVDSTAPHEAQGAVPGWLKYPSDTNRPSAEEPPVGSDDWMGGISSALEQTPPTPAAKPGRPSTGRLLGAQNADPNKGGTIRSSGREAASPTKKITPPAGPFGREPVSPAPGSTPPALGPDWDFPSNPPPDFPFAQSAGNFPPLDASAAFPSGTEPMVSPAGEGEIPDWLVDIKKESAAPAPEPEPEPPMATPDLNELLRPDTLPEWMHRPTEAAPKGKGAGPASVPPATPDNLEQAELPRWLEAMRPIRSVAMPTEDEERVESVGPLAGLRGVLSAEPVVAMPRRPGIMAGNIDASPTQLTLTETLRRLLIEPEVRASRKPVRAMLLTPLVRKAMSAVLILAIVFPFFAGSLFSSSVYLPKANEKAGIKLSELPADQPVLVAFEYDASSAPELETGASVLLEHLAQRGISVAFISSQPNGTVLGEGLQMLNEDQGVKMPARIADFGYIPGGAGGLRRLAGNLRGTINGANAEYWNQPAVASIHSLSDFSMILVVAANPQSVRDWVEQVHTASPKTPIVAVVSASSDALVFPYTEGSKPAIWGLVAGYAGAQAYRSRFLPATLPTSGVAALRWQAFAGGTLAILFTLIAGAIGSLALGRLRKTRKAGE